eukprot:2958680-Pyramimonas_sp.AAC.1
MASSCPLRTATLGPAPTARSRASHSSSCVCTARAATSTTRGTALARQSARPASRRWYSSRHACTCVSKEASPFEVALARRRLERQLRKE